MHFLHSDFFFHKLFSLNECKLRTLPGMNDWFFFMLKQRWLSCLYTYLWRQFVMVYLQITNCSDKDKHKFKLINWFWTLYEWKNKLEFCWTGTRLVCIKNALFIQPLVVEQREYCCKMNNFYEFFKNTTKSKHGIHWTCSHAFITQFQQLFRIESGT